MRKNVASQTVCFQAVSTTDGSAVTAGTPVVYYSLDGAAQGTASANPTHLGNGQWKWVPTQAETNANHAAYTFTLTGAVSQCINIYTITSDLETLNTSTTISGNVSDILTDTGTTLPGTLTTIEGKVDTVDTVVDAILLDTGTDGVVVAAASKTGYTLTATTGLGNQTANITGNLSGSVGSVTGAVGSVTGNVGGNVTGSVGSISGVTFPTNFGDMAIAVTTGYVTTGTIANGAITAAAIATDAIDADALAADAIAEINATVDTALTDIGLDHLVAASVTGTDITDNSIVAKLVSSSATADWDTFVNTTDSLQAIADSGGGGPTAAQIADAVWDETMADHLTGGTTGASLNGAGSAGDPWTTSLPGAYGAGTAGYILGTNLNAPVGTVDTVVDGIATTLGSAGAGLTAIPWNAAWDAEVQSEVADGLAAFWTSPATLVDLIWDEPTSGHVTAGTVAVALTDILTDTGTTIPATLTTITNYVDVIDDGTSGLVKIAQDVAAVLVDTGTTLPATLTTITNYVDLIDDGTSGLAKIATDVAAILVDTGTTVPAQISALNNLSAAQVNAEVVDVLTTDTFAELAGVPAATSSLKDKLTWMFMVSRNKLTQTATTATVYADDTTTSVSTSTVSDDATTFTRGEYA